MALKLRHRGLIYATQVPLAVYGLSAGLLINFKERMVKDGIRRFVLSKYFYKTKNLRVFFAFFAIFAL